MNDEDFFEKLGLSLHVGEVEIGQTYPIYGIVTNILSEELGNIKVELNFGSIIATLTLDEIEKLDIIKSKCFEPGIFICTITSKANVIYADCSTIIFGKSSYNKDMLN